jgi:carbon-monoxide dehydrogenase small subunit
MSDCASARKIEIRVNGHVRCAEAPVRMNLADFLRHELHLTGTHVGCEHGVCGACTILFDGHSVRSCLMLAVQAHGHDLTTIEGLAPSPDRLHPLQEAMAAEHGLQCGFCTPGMLCTLAELLAMNPDPSDEDIRLAISGNLCRCTGYDGIVRATLRAAAQLRGGDKAGASS